MKSSTDPIDDVKSALKGQPCTDCWIGFGQVIFVGFSAEPSDAVDSSRRYEFPPFQIQTRFANWSLMQGKLLIARSSDEPRSAQAATQALVGKRVMDVTSGSFGSDATVVFESTLSLRISRMSGCRPGEEFWSLRFPDGRYLVISCGGEATYVPAGAKV